MLDNLSGHYSMGTRVAAYYKSEQCWQVEEIVEITFSGYETTALSNSLW